MQLIDLISKQNIIKTNAITVTSQRFNLNSTYRALKHRSDIWTGLGSGCIIDNIE